MALEQMRHARAGSFEAVVRPVEADARGIVAPAAGLRKFRLERYTPAAPVARFVDRYWIVSWNLRDDHAYTQQVLAHPVVNVVFTPEGAYVHGVTTRLGSRVLEGAGRGFGIMFRPAGFRPILGGPMAAITDRVVPVREMFGRAPFALEDARAGGAPDERLVAEADAFLRPLLPDAPVASERTTAMVERVAADPSVVRVDTLASEAGITPRQLQRRFADHVGVSPKAVVRRYRLYEAAERRAWVGASTGRTLAAELGYADQAHLIRDFAGALGTTPNRYAREMHAIG
jgi:AraC-like DNA-binding protein